jgi:hypothetical protein
MSLQSPVMFCVEDFGASPGESEQFFGADTANHNPASDGTQGTKRMSWPETSAEFLSGTIFRD